MWNERRRMDSWQARSGWQIAEVQQLTGLPRRDIQRACYEGAGGTGLVHPQESSWGKRSYDENDLTQLFCLKQLRDEGLSLPEASRLLQAAHADGAGWGRYEADQQARLREPAEDAAGRLANADALHAATAGAADHAQLDACIYVQMLQGAVELSREQLQATPDAIANSPAAEALAWLAADGRDKLAALLAKLALCRQRELAPDDVQVQTTLRGALRTASPRDCTGTLSCEAFALLLEAPGMELSLELRLGPGGFAFVTEALQADGRQAPGD